MIVNWRPIHFSFLNFKGTPSQDEIALSDQIVFPAFFCLWKMTYHNFINSGICQSAVAFAL
jgi:hypothetical protein